MSADVSNACDYHNKIADVDNALEKGNSHPQEHNSMTEEKELIKLRNKKILHLAKDSQSPTHLKDCAIGVATSQRKLTAKFLNPM